MKISLLFIIFSLSFLTLFPPPSSAHLFPNISSIPSSLNPKNTSWDAFLNLKGCQFGEKRNGLEKIKQYFQYFGYINSTSSSNFTDDFDDYLESAVKTYQRNFNLNQTGELDGPTLAHIVKPRCGNPDIVNGTTTMNSGRPNNSTVARYSFFPGRPRWPEGQTVLTYAFASGNQLDEATRAVFARAFERWSEVTPLNFTEIPTYSAADIRIGFFSGDHNDGEPFDGVMGTLAHAFSPPAGFFHLDEAENWVLDGNFVNAPSFSTAVDLESVAVHEIGHVLGLGHSSVEDAIMYPSLTAATRKVELAADDILGVQELYGSNPNFNGTLPSLTPRNERDIGGSEGKMRPFAIFRMFLVAGFLLFLL
jgi:hypothetical protein